MSGDIHEVEARLRTVEAHLDELTQAAEQSRRVLAARGILDDTDGETGDTCAPNTAGTDDGNSGLQPAYSSLAAWVEGFFAPTFARPLGGEYRWCSQWWDHHEALFRLRGLWASFEAARADPQRGMTNWTVYYLDPQLPILLGPHGPFARCDTDKHRPDRALPTAPAPAGLPS